MDSRIATFWNRLRTAFDLLLLGRPGAIFHRVKRRRRRKILRKRSTDEACASRLAVGESSPTLLQKKVSRLQFAPPVYVSFINIIKNSTDDAYNYVFSGGGGDYPGVIRLLKENAAPLGRLTSLLDRAGDGILLLVESGDVLKPGAVSRIVLRFDDDPDLAALFGDEEIVRAHAAAVPLLKPGWSPDLLRGSFYTGWPLALRPSALKGVALDTALSGPPAIYDLLLSICQRRGAVAHLPAILRTGPGRTGESDEKMMPVLDRYFRSQMPGTRAERGPFPGSWRIRRPPLAGVTIDGIIPTRDGLRFLKPCVNSVRRASGPSTVRPVVVDNGSRDVATLEWLSSMEAKGALTLLPYPHRFNFSAMANLAARSTDSDLLLFLNNDTEMLESDSLETMAAEAMRPEVAAVGPLMLYPDGTIQHAGLVTGMGIVAGHLYKRSSLDGADHFISPRLMREVSAVDGACFMIRRKLFLEMGGFDEKNLAVSFGDVDFCLRARDAGYRNIYNPFAVFMHHETSSRSRRLDEREVAFMENRWGKRLEEDPFYHPALSLVDEYPWLEV